MKQMREEAMKIGLKAIEAVLPENAVKAALQGEEFSKRLEGPGKVVMVAIGKAAWRMAKAAADVLGDRLHGGTAVTKYEHSMGEIPGVEIFEAGHPFPDENTLLGTARALEKVKDLSEDDTVLFMVSGGGSALFERPRDGVTLEDLVSVTDQLLACGADIVEINMIRKRLSSVKGGRFAQLVAPAHIFAVVLSDVLGDRLDSIASGPAHPDGSTIQEALRIVDKYGLKLRPGLLEALEEETPKELDNVSTVIAGSVTSLCAAAEKTAAELGYKTLLLTTTLSCEAREAGSFMASIAQQIRETGQPAAPPCAILLGGETIVHLKGKGKGGRNQEIALAASVGLKGLKDTVLLSIGSDGTDGPTDAAGGLVDGKTVDNLKGLGLDPEAVLAENDSYNGLDACGCLVITGPTGTNVNDLTVLLCR